VLPQNPIAEFKGAYFKGEGWEGERQGSGGEGMEKREGKTGERMEIRLPHSKFLDPPLWLMTDR